MHEIALKTKQETLSMHVIIVFTLIFLPGTFIAVRNYLSRWGWQSRGDATFDQELPLTAISGSYTFLGSGVLRWDEDGTLGSDWVVRGDGMRPFIAISLPMMVIIISG